jgi:thiol-disulfide isomerase/thioredoxin
MTRSRTAHRFAALLTLTLVVSSTAAPPPAPVWDADAFQALDLAHRLAFVKDALVWRENRLQNFYYELDEVIQDVDGKTRAVKRQVGDVRHYQVARLGDSYLASGIADVGYAGDRPRRFWSRWDGSTYRTFTEGGNINKPAGVIRDEEHNLLFQIEYNLLLGWRAHGKIRVRHGVGNNLPMTLVQWIDFFLERGKDATPRARLIQREGKSLLELEAQDGYSTLTYWLDPARQYLPVKSMNWYQYGEHGHGGTITTTDAREFDGFWTPTRVVFNTTHANDPLTDQERIYTIASFVPNCIKPDNLRVKFGPGTQVVDAAAVVAYHLDDQRNPTANPLGDTKSGTAGTATDAELAEELLVNPLDDDLTKAAITARAASIRTMVARVEARRRAGDPVWGKLAPAFPADATWHNAKPLTWQDLRGKVVILHFFAEWCGPCKNDYPMLVNLDKNKKPNLAIIGVHAAGSDPAKVTAMLEQYKLAYPVCVDVPAAPGVEGFGQLSAAMNAKMAPHAILIDTDGKVIERGTLMDVYEAAIPLLTSHKAQK